MEARPYRDLYTAQVKIERKCKIVYDPTGKYRFMLYWYECAGCKRTFQQRVGEDAEKLAMMHDCPTVRQLWR